MDVSSFVSLFHKARIHILPEKSESAELKAQKFLQIIQALGLTEAMLKRKEQNDGK